MKRVLFLIPLLFATHLIAGQEVPDPPVFLNVSVDPVNGWTSFYWLPSPSPEVDGYVLFKEDIIQGGYNPIDTIWGIGSTEFTWETANGQLLSETYVIGAIDTSGTNDRESPYTSPHTSIFLHTKSFNPCNISIELEWNPYVGWDTNFSYYTIHRKRDLQAWDTVPTYNGHDTLFTDTDIVPYSTYCYYIEAHHKDGITNSTCYRGCIPANTEKPPDSIQAYGTRFLDENLVQLTFFTDPTSELDDYYLVRFNEATQAYDTVKRIKSSGEANITLGDVPPGPGSYSYRLYSMNRCGQVAVASNPANLIWLEGSNRNFRNFLDWNLFHTWPEGVEYYSLYRSIDGAAPESISIQSPPDSSYTDHIEDVIYTSTTGRFCYYVEAVTIPMNQTDTMGFSRSNVFCLTPEPKIIIPNAFTPNDDGLNETFMPVLTFLPVDYVFVVRSRWGNTIFQTNDPQAAWDGSHAGRKVPEGVYMYHLRATAPGGQVLEKNGKVTVLYPNK
jgi:gliding motility-associated-like protein